MVKSEVSHLVYAVNNSVLVVLKLVLAVWFARAVHCYFAESCEVSTKGKDQIQL